MNGLLVGLALCYVLFKIPSWVLGSIRGGGGGKSFLGSAIRGIVTYKSLGLLRAGAQSVASWRIPRTAGKGDKRPSDPYAQADTTEQGQGILPLGPLTRTRPRERRHSAPQTEATGGTQTRRGREADRRRSEHWRGAQADAHAAGSGSRRAAQGSGTRGSGSSARQGRLFTPGGTANAAAVPQRHPGGLPVWQRPGEQRMLPIITAHDPTRTGRETLGDEHARREPHRAPTSPRQTTLFRPQSGELNRQALPPHRRPAAVGQQQHLELEPRGMPQPAQPARAQQPARESRRAAPSQPGSSPPLSRHQMPLLHRDGRPTRQSQAVPGAEQRTHATQQARQAREARRARAQARNHRRHGSTAAAPVPEFLAPRPVSTGPTNPPPAPSPVEDPGRGRSSPSDDEGKEPADE